MMNMLVLLLLHHPLLLFLLYYHPLLNLLYQPTCKLLM